MKKITALIMVLAIMAAVGCSSDSNSSVSDESIDAETVVTQAQETVPETTEEATEPEAYGLVLSNDVYGYSLILPDGLNSLNGEIIDDPEVISQTDYIMINSSTSKDNLNVVVESAKTPESFDGYTKESYKEQCDALGVFKNFTVNTFEKTKVDGFDAFYIETSAQNPDGEDFSQIQIIVNRYDEAVPYCYTFTYTDYSGTLRDEYSKSADSISMTEPEKSASAEDEHAGEPFTFEMCKGLEFSAPDGWKITEGESETPHVITGDQAMFSPPELGDVSNLIVTVSESADNNDDFLTYTQEDFEALLSDSYQGIKTVSFKTVKVGNYDAHKFICDINDEDTQDLNLRQTMLFINCPDKNSGILICLTDYNQKNSKISDTLETLIKFT
ncbi:hypothetical protein [Porcipelethomonas sp.]|uniref:hypothetical protein n=1 Tax=Porcipelethomonas sp. TaxID=2981675 RepID=UPI003EF7FF62